MSTLILLALISLFMMIQTTLAAQGPTECHDPAMTRWMLNNEGENPCTVVQDVIRVCNPSFNINWLTSSYSCDNAPGSITAACCCGSPTFALLSACWSCQYNYTMEIVSTTFTGFEKDCASVPNPLTSYDPIISSLVDQIDIPLWAKIEPAAGKWDLTAAWRNATPTETTSPPVPTSYPTPSSSATLSAGAIIGIIVGSVFGTALMFILAAFILWKCLGIGRYRNQQQRQDPHVGQDMNYMDGEYVSVHPEGMRRRDTRLDLDASDYDDDTSRPLQRPYTRSSSYLGPDGASYRAPDGSSYTEPPSPYSPARHASLDGKFQGYHPGASPQSVHRQSMEGSPVRMSASQHRMSASQHRISESQHRPSGSRDRPLSGNFTPIVNRRPISGQFSVNRASGQYSVHRPSSHHRQSGSHSRSGSGQAHHRMSGSPYRSSMERKRDHRVSVRSNLRPASFDSGEGGGGSGGRFVRIEEQRPSLDGARFGGRPRFSWEGVGRGRRSRDEGPRYDRDEGRGYARDEEPRRSRDEGVRFEDDEGPRFSRDDGHRFTPDDGPRYSQDGGRRGRFSRDEYHKPSLSEGDEDLEDADTGEGPQATGSGFNNHQGHLRKRSQSARTSCDPGHEFSSGSGQEVQGLGLETEPISVPPSSSAPTTNSGLGGAGPGTGAGPSTSKGRTLRIANATSEDGESVSRSTSVMREPGLLARARTLMHVATPKSSRSAHSSPGHTQNLNPPSAGPVPPSAWQRLRNIPSALSLSGQARSSIGSESDATSAYHTAQGHSTPLGTATGTGSGGAGTPVTEFGRTVRAESALGQVPMSEEGGRSSGYHQESDAGVQLVVEESGGTTTPEDTHLQPPAYASEEAEPSQASLRPRPPRLDSSSLGHSDLESSSVLARDSGNWDSGSSSVVIQTWTAARRPTGFVGTGRVVPGVRETGAEQEVLWTSGEAVSSRSAVLTLGQEEDRRSGPGASDRGQH